MDKKYVEALAQANIILGSRADLLGMDLGKKIVSNKETDDIAIRLFTKTKSSNTQNSDFPDNINSVPTDVIGLSATSSLLTPEESLPSESEVDAVTEAVTEWAAGIYVQRFKKRFTMGALGAIVFDANNGHYGILSAHHVLSAKYGKPGDDGWRIIMSGSDVGDSTVAKLMKASKIHDCAFAELPKMSRYSLKAHPGTNKKFSTPIEPQEGMKVRKYGPTTGLTEGIISSSSPGYYSYTGSEGVQYRVKGWYIKSAKDNDELSLGGDSGSIWYHIKNNAFRPVGLHVAGNHEANHPTEWAFMSDMTLVQKALNISFKPI